MAQNGAFFFIVFYITPILRNLFEAVTLTFP